MRNSLTSLENRKSDDSLISSYAYGHDDVGNRTSMTEANGDVTSYTYDDVYRLTDETKRDSGSNVLYRYQYTYDGVGNRLSETHSGVITYTYDANNKLTQLVGPSGATTFGYDGDGNMTSMAVPGPVTWNYSYDYENKLIGVANDAGYSAAYTYAVDGRRVRAQESNAPNPDLWFLYDGVRPLMEGTLAGDTYTFLKGYVWEGSAYEDPLVFANLGGTRYHYMYDGLGSTRQLLDDAQTVTDTYAYEAFGNSMGSTGSTRNPYRYVGALGYYQTGSSLMQLGARYYMPEIGRFIQTDPASLIADYVYAKARPLVRVDPAGLKDYSWKGVVVANRAWKGRSAAIAWLEVIRLDYEMWVTETYPSDTPEYDVAMSVLTKVIPGHTTTVAGSKSKRRPITIEWKWHPDPGWRGIIGCGHWTFRIRNLPNPPKGIDPDL